MRVTKQFTFHAAHRDTNAEDQCGRLHGHTYKVEITFSGIPKGDMLLHGDVLKEIYQSWIEPKVEHQFLNDTLAPLNPTMENVAIWIRETASAALYAMREASTTLPPGRLHVRLWETPTMYVDV